MDAFDVLDIQNQDLGFATITDGKLEFTFKNGIVASNDWNPRITHPYRMIEHENNIWVCFYDRTGLIFDEDFTVVGGFYRYGNWNITGECQYVYDLAADNTTVYAASYNLRRIGAFLKGTDQAAWSISTTNNPYSITTLPNGNIAVAFYNGGTGGRGHIDELDATNGATVRVLLDSTPGSSVPWADGVSNPIFIRHINRGGSDEVWISHYTAGIIAIYDWDDTTGLTLKEMIGEHSPLQSSYNSYSFAYDADNNYTYIASASRKIYTIDMQTKNLIGEFGKPILDVDTDKAYSFEAVYAPWGVLYSHGKVIITDYSNQKIMAFHPDVIMDKEVKIQYSVPKNNYLSVKVAPDNYNIADSTLTYRASDLLKAPPPEEIAIVGIIEKRR